MEDNPHDKLDKLNQEIFKRDFKTSLPDARPHLSGDEPEARTKWDHAYLSDAVQTVPPKVRLGPFFRKVFIASVLFFIVSAALLAYIFFGGWNVVSVDKLDISYVGPVSISAGNELAFDIVLNNQNRLGIRDAVLYVYYPEGTKRVDDVTKDLLHEKFELGDIPSKSQVRRTSRSIQFGELNAVRSMNVVLEYKLKNSNAAYRKEETHDISISSTPLTVEVAHATDVVAGETVEFKVKVTSNSSSPINELLLRAQYPFGFSFMEAEPAATANNSIWFIPVLKPGESKEFAVRGRLQGEQGDERVFRFAVGSQSAVDEEEIATTFLTKVESVNLQRPPLGLSLALAGSKFEEYVTEQGSFIQSSVEVTNNLSVKVIDAKVEVNFSGRLFDAEEVKPEGGGIYRLSDKKIVWDKFSDSRLGSLEPGASVLLTFSFMTIPTSEATIKNGTMSVSSRAEARRATDAGTEPTLTAVQSKTVRTRTSASVLSRAVYSTGPFRNKGPVPPKVDTKTTYTIIWSATNSLNDIRGAEVRATLPANVRWLGIINPGSESMIWNSDKNEVVWRVGDLSADAGVNRPAREVAFQVELTPSLNQVGETLQLVSVPILTGTDAFTNTLLSVSAAEVTTRLTTDPAYNGSEAKVVR